MFHGENALTADAADSLLRGGLIREGEKFILSRDLRHRVASLYGYSKEIWIEFLKGIACPHLLVVGSHKSVWYKQGTVIKLDRR